MTNDTTSFTHFCTEHSLLNMVISYYYPYDLTRILGYGSARSYTLCVLVNEIHHWLIWAFSSKILVVKASFVSQKPLSLFQIKNFSAPCEAPATEMTMMCLWQPPRDPKMVTFTAPYISIHRTTLARVVQLDHIHVRDQMTYSEQPEALLDEQEHFTHRGARGASVATITVTAIKHLNMTTLRQEPMWRRMV